MRNTLRSGFRNQATNPGPKPRYGSAVRLPLCAPLDDLHRLAMGYFKPSLTGEFPVRLCHRVEVNSQLASQTPHGWKYVAGDNPALHQIRSERLDNLAVHRDRRGEIDSKLNISGHCMLSMYRIQLQQIAVNGFLT